jgi:hypothetical protein
MTSGMRTYNSAVGSQLRLHLAVGLTCGFCFVSRRLRPSLSHGSLHFLGHPRSSLHLDGAGRCRIRVFRHSDIKPPAGSCPSVDSRRQLRDLNSLRRHPMWLQCCQNFLDPVGICGGAFQRDVEAAIAFGANEIRADAVQRFRAL